MNIEHDGKTYEVLTLGRISEITHAKLAGGKVVKPEFSELVKEYYIDMSGEVWQEDWVSLGIQPLRLVQKEPVTFEACVDRRGWIPAPKEAEPGKRFRCVEIVEEA